MAVNQGSMTHHLLESSHSAIDAVPQLSAIVLAGGQSSRMGVDKALVEIEGQPMLRRVCEVALSCTPWVYVVSAWNHRYRSILDSRVEFVQEVSLLKDRHPHGPLVGFVQGLQQVRTEWVLLLACDMPQLKTEMLHRWIQELPCPGSDAVAAIAKNRKGWWEPMCGFYRQDCQKSLEAFIQSGGRSFQRWLDSQKVQELLVDDPAMLFNCNTPADIEEFERGRGTGQE